jgi:membrane associated rhomboid family serine protease
MGLQDRDYSRDPSQGHSWGGNSGGSSWGESSSTLLGGGGVRSITITLIIINVVIFFLDSALSGSNGRSVMTDWFAVRADTLIKPWTWYRFLGYGFVHNNDDIWHLAFNMFGLFIFGRLVEGRMGRGEYLRFYLLAVIIGGLVASLRWTLFALSEGAAVSAIPVSTIGASGAVMAVTILFAFYFPDATILLMLVVPVKAWLMAVIYVVMNIFGVIGGSGPVAYEVHLAGAAFAAVYHLRSWRLEHFGRGGIAGATDFFTRRKPNLRLHDPEKKLAKQEAEVDRILEKIQLSGLDSLTSGERKTLERHSRLKRQQRSS